MKCSNCGFENKDTAKFCSKCGMALEIPPEPPAKNNANSKIIIITLVIIIAILVASIGFFALNSNSDSPAVQSNSSQASADSNDDSSQESASTPTTTVVESKDWELIGSYSGSGSGSQSISVPAGDIMIKLSAYPIKNYASNHLYVTGSNGESAGVDWGSTSAVETRSDSLTYSSSSSVTFTIDYYETVSWQVDFYRYQ